jgi:hypothetical protein
MTEMRIGPVVTELGPRGDCPDCGGRCSPECGRHAAGCVFGGFGEGYWLIADRCPEWHGDDRPRGPLDADVGGSI